MENNINKSPALAEEETRIMQNVFHLVKELGGQLQAQGFPPPVLWYLLSCAARTVEHGLILVTRQQPEALPMLNAARRRLPELFAVVDHDVTTTIPLSDAEQENAQWKLWALALLGRPESDFATAKPGELWREIEQWTRGHDKSRRPS